MATKLAPVQMFDLGSKMVPWEQRRAEGKALRDAIPRESHAGWKPGKKRPDPMKLLATSNKGRQSDFVPLRMGRVAASPFVFLRGAVCVMAADLSTLPLSGIPVVMAGDAHINNFGMYGTPQREVVFDMNDFDEATIGPWEWDLKRLVASVNVAGRQNGLNRRERAAAVMRGVEGYRLNITRLQVMGVLDVWYLHAYPGQRQSPRQGRSEVQGSLRQDRGQSPAHRQPDSPPQGCRQRGAWELELPRRSAGLEADKRGVQSEGNRRVEPLCAHPLSGAAPDA